MRQFNALAAIAVAALMAGDVSAKEKAGQPKQKKICRTEEMPGRITPRRTCRIVAPGGAGTEANQRKTGESREANND